MTDTPNASGEPDELYLDAAATEPVTRNVIEAMMPFMTDAYANPASVHQPGKTAARALDAARASFAAGLGARPDDVIFTSGGTESDNLAIKGIAMARMRALGLQPVYGLAGIDDEPFNSEFVGKEDNEKGAYTESEKHVFGYDGDLSVTYGKLLAERHMVNAVAGMRFTQSTSNLNGYTMQIGRAHV